MNKVLFDFIKLYEVWRMELGSIKKLFDFVVYDLCLFIFFVIFLLLLDIEFVLLISIIVKWLLCCVVFGIGSGFG